MPEKSFSERAEALRLGLVNAQYRLRDANHALLVLMAGDDRIACEQIIDRLQHWMDARLIDVWLTETPTDEELAHPPAWRYWRALPPDGRTGIYIGAWVVGAIGNRLRGDASQKDYRRSIDHLVQFEDSHRANGTMVLKLWISVPPKTVKRRLKKADSDPDLAKMFEQIDWKIYDLIDDAKPIIEATLADSSRLYPWTVVEDSSIKERDLAVGQAILDALEHAVEGRIDVVPATPATVEIRDHLGAVDLDASLDEETYKKELAELQVKIHEQSLEIRKKNRSVVLVFEGWDAAGKGGAIRRITQALSVRDCKIHPIAAPTDEELAHHYLWRFWRRIPRAGKMAIFDRSWYGRVLVERVEHFTTEDMWRRAYQEINDFEALLVEHGMAVAKFWLHISPEEQLVRFKAREQTPYKKYKITEEDYRNREKWPQYVEAVNEMVERTGNEHAPWHVIAANDKRHARIEILSVVHQALKKLT